MLIFPMGLLQDDPGISKVMKISKTKFKWQGIQIIKINRLKFDGSGTTPSYFTDLRNMVILGHFSQYRAKG